NQRTQAEQLLDQLKALQLGDGSLAFAYDVKTGNASGQIRSNALAWVGIAAVAYYKKYNNKRYDQLVRGLAEYLLAERRSDGLVLGGPDVTWVSTQHNILASEFFRSGGDAYGANGSIGGGLKGRDLTAAYNTMANAIISQLLVQAGPLAYFTEGVNDPRQALD